MRFIKKKEIVNTNIKVNFFCLVFASGFFTGFFPLASGTVGSAFALAFFLIPGFHNLYVLFPLIILSFFLGILSSKKMIERYGDDPSVIVIDEFVGMWITVAVSALYDFCLLSVLVGFFMFRLFDIVKLYPAAFFDNMKNGFGIMMDDVIAGLYAGAATVLILLLLKNIFHYACL